MERPGTLDVEVITRDRTGRTTFRTYRQALRIINREPDTALPEVHLLKPTGELTFDVRDSSRRVTIEARITDEGSGVVAHGGHFCLFHPFQDGYTNLQCTGGDLVSGTLHDGVWRAHVTIPQGAIGGDWNVGIRATDNAHPAKDANWMGPDLYRHWTSGGLNAGPDDYLFPDGRGRISVLGATDSTPPKIASAEVTPSQVDTLPGSATVHVRVRATDTRGEGVTGVSAGLGNTKDWTPGTLELPGADLMRTSGTRLDGIWEGDITLPQGVPPGTYYLSLTVQDLTHWRGYVAAGSPAAEDPNNEILPTDPKVIVVEHPTG